MSSWNARQEIFSTMPLRSFVAFCFAVACTFAAIGVVNDLFELEHSDVRHMILKVLATAGFAVLWLPLQSATAFTARADSRRFRAQHRMASHPALPFCGASPR
jgi:hypothetical protein